VCCARGCRSESAAAPMVTALSDSRTLTPYTAPTPKQPLGGRNQPNAYRARDSMKLALERPDEADEETLPEIVWHSIKGADVPLPQRKTAFRSRPLQEDD